MSYYKEKTDFLKTMKLEDAYLFLLNNIGYFYNPNIDVSSIKKTAGFVGVGLNPHLIKSYNKENPRLIGPHTAKERELMQLGAKPLIFDGFGIKNNYGFSENEIKNYHIESDYLSIDPVYIELFKIARSEFKSNQSSHMVAGTILGYSKTSIELFTITQNFNKRLGFTENILYNENMGLFDSRLGIYNKSTLPNLNSVIFEAGLNNEIYYSGELCQSKLNKLLLELRARNILDENFKIIKADELFFGDIDYVIRTG